MDLDDIMENLKDCPVCGETRHTKVISANDYLVTKQIFSIVRCDNCGLLFTNPRPHEGDLSRFYCSEEYISHTDSKRSLFEKIYSLIRRYMLRKKIRLIKKHTRKNRDNLLLDYGCATGEFLLQARLSGYNVMGVEPGDQPRNKAIEKELLVFNTPKNLLSGQYDQSFDVITLWHVLEHISELHDTMKIFERIISDNGLIVVAVPEHNSFDAKFYKQHWAAWDVPRHLNHFHVKSLVRLFGTHGFTLEKVYPLWFDSFYVGLLTEKSLSKGIAGSIRAFVIGCISNVLAFLNIYPYSSHIYFFRKSERS